MRNKTTLWTLMIASAICALSLTQTADARVRQRRLTTPSPNYNQGGVSLYASIGGQGYEIHDRDYDDFNAYDDRGFFSLGLGIGLDPRTLLFVEGMGSGHDSPAGDLNLGHLHVGVKYAPSTGANHRWQPYGKASVGASFLMEDREHYYPHDEDYGDNGFVGPSLGLGIGVEHFLSRRAALFGELGVNWMKFNHAIIDDESYDLIDDFTATAGRLQFGLRLRL